MPPASSVYAKSREGAMVSLGRRRVARVVTWVLPYHSHLTSLGARVQRAEE